MAKGMRSATWATSGDAAWQAWCNAIYNVFIDAGWVHDTGPSGQRAVPAADTYPVANTYTYWILRLNDAAQTNAPVYLKLEVGRGSATTNAILRFTLGTGVSSAGAIVQPFVTQIGIGGFHWTPSTTVATVFQACVEDGGAWFNVAEFNSNAAFLLVSRTVNDAGAVTEDAVIGTIHTFNNGYVNGLYDYNDGRTYTAPSGLFDLPTAFSLSEFGSFDNVALFKPMIRLRNGLFQWGGFYGVHRYELSQGGVVPVNQFGLGAKDYVTVTSQGGNQWPRQVDRGHQTLATLLLVWD